MNPEAYFKLCEAHDWDWHISDDPTVHSKGMRVQDYLINLATENSELREIFLAWSRYANPRKPQLSDFVPQNQTPLTGQKD